MKITFYLLFSFLAFTTQIALATMIPPVEAYYLSNEELINITNLVGEESNFDKNFSFKNCLIFSSGKDKKRCLDYFMLEKIRETKEKISKNYDSKDTVLMPYLHQKNALMFQYVYENINFVLDKKTSNISINQQLLNLDLIIGMEGEWNKLSEILPAIDQSYIPLAINQDGKKSQVLMAYYSNNAFQPDVNDIWGQNDNSGTQYSFLIRLAYSFMKAHIQENFKDVYQNIFHYMGPTIGHPGNSSFEDDKKFTNDKFSNIAKFENHFSSLIKKPEVSTVDFFWQAHNGDVPLSLDFLKKFPSSKVRMINNTWCNGEEEFRTRFSPSMANYVMVSQGINNPFPFNFINNYFLKYNFPIGLSETLARIVHLQFYKNALSSVNFSSIGLIGLRNTLDLYSSWFNHYGNNSFALADKLRTSTKEITSILYKNKLPILSEEVDRTTPLLYQSSTELGPILGPLVQTLLEKTGAGISLSHFNGFTSDKIFLNSNNRIKFIKNTLIESMLVSIHSFIPGKKELQLDGQWMTYQVPTYTLKEFEQIARMKDYTEWKGDLSVLQRYFTTQIERLSLSIKEKNEQVKIKIGLKNEIRGNFPGLSNGLALLADSVPFLKDLHIDPLRGFQLGKEIEIILSFNEPNTLSIKFRGIKLYTSVVYQIDVPEIIVDLETGYLQLIQDAGNIFDLGAVLKTK